MAKDIKKQDASVDPNAGKGDEMGQKPGAIATQGGRELQSFEFGEDEGKGLDNVTAEEYRLPFFRVLDPKSPQVAPVERNGMMRTDNQKAVAGDILVTQRKEVWRGDKKGFVWLPVYRHEDFIEWIPKEVKNPDGTTSVGPGGFVGIHEPSARLVGELRKAQGRFGKLKMDNGNELVQTYTVYGLAFPWVVGTEYDFDFDNPVPGMIAYASTQISKYNSMVGKYMNMKYPNGQGVMKLPPLWAHRWHSGTQMDPPNKAGQTWYGWVLGLQRSDDGKEELDKTMAVNKPGSPLYLAGKTMYEMIIDQVYKVDYSQAGPGPDETTEAGRGDAYEGDAHRIPTEGTNGGGVDPHDAPM